MKLYVQDIESMDKRYRTNFVNSLPGFKSANLIGTISNSGIPNLAIFGSVIHVGASPALMGMLFRPVSVPRHTYQNIKHNGLFTINHISDYMYKRAHQTAARYPDDISEFEAVGLTPEYSGSFDAPYVREASVKIGLKLVEEQEIHSNKTIFVIGQIEEVVLPDNIILEDGVIDLQKVRTITISSLNSYHKTELIERLPYAKPEI